MRKRILPFIMIMLTIFTALPISASASTLYYGKTINFARYLLNSKHLKSVRDENIIFYYLKEVYGDRNSNFLNYTKAYAFCSILSKADNIVTTQMCNNYISELSPNEVEDAKQLISKWIVNEIWGG